MALVERASSSKRAAAAAASATSEAAPPLMAPPPLTTTMTTSSSSSLTQPQPQPSPYPSLLLPSPRGLRGRRSLGAGAPSVRELPRAKHVGILAMEVYFPDTYVDQADLEVADGAPAGKYTSGLGRLRLGFAPSDAEDAISMALTAANRLLVKTGTHPSEIGSLQVGTESSPDRSKSVKTALMRLFEPCGVTDVDGVDCVNACYGGTAALLSAVNWVESRAWDGRRLALVVATDVPVYAAGPARPAGGGGAVAMLVGPDAPLDLERGLAGAWMSDEWDFYKPAGCGLWPVVDGARSVAAYLKGLDACWAALCDKADARLAAASAAEEGERNGENQGKSDEGGRRQSQKKPSPSPRPPFSLSDVDHVVMHAPYGKLLRKGFARMAVADERRRRAREEGGEGGEEEQKGKARRIVGPGPDFDERAAVKSTAASFGAYVGPSCWLAAESGNMCAASVHAGLAALVEEKGGKSSEGSRSGGGRERGLEGARILVYSYGSGAAACLFSVTARQVSDASGKFTLEKLASSLKISEALAKRRRATPADFTKALALAEARWGACDYRPTREAIDAVAPGVWYLEEVDEKHRRRYERKPLAVEVEEKKEKEAKEGGGGASSPGNGNNSSSSSSTRPFPPPPSDASRLAAGASADNLVADLLEKLSAG